MTPSASPSAPPTGPAALLRGPALQRAVQIVVPRPLAEVRGRLEGAIHRTVEPFTLISKLSGGGIVVRALRTPETDRPFFGRLQGDRFTVGHVYRGGDQTPFQPLVRGALASEGGGTAVTLTLAPHPNAQNWDVLFTLAGVGLLAGGAVQALTSAWMAGALVGFGVASLALPRLRARASFEVECRRVLTALSEVLDAPELAASR